jgi:hypothetical protein
LLNSTHCVLARKAFVGLDREIEWLLGELKMNIRKGRRRISRTNFRNLKNENRNCAIRFKNGKQVIGEFNWLLEKHLMNCLVD